MPSHTSREILVIFGSLTSCDPDPIQETINMVKAKKICCNFIGLSAELYICKKLAESTNGKFGVILDESHFWVLLSEFIPPPEGNSSESSLMKMGFPHLVTADTNGHISYSMSSKKFSVGGYYCPQCRAKYSELPVQCVVCRLTLVSAPHLARSYHHLFPLPQFIEINFQENESNTSCHSCLRKFTQKQTFHQCERCNINFCLDCNLYIHETLHCCPGCINTRCELGTVQS